VANSILVIKLALCYSVIDIDRWKQKFSILIEVVESVNTSGCLLGDTLYVFCDACEVSVVSFLN